MLLVIVLSLFVGFFSGLIFASLGSRTRPTAAPIHYRPNSHAAELEGKVPLLFVIMLSACGGFVIGLFF